MNVPVYTTEQRRSEDLLVGEIVILHGYHLEIDQIWYLSEDGALTKVVLRPEEGPAILAAPDDLITVVDRIYR